MFSLVKYWVRVLGIPPFEHLGHFTAALPHNLIYLIYFSSNLKMSSPKQDVRDIHVAKTSMLIKEIINGIWETVKNAKLVKASPYFINLKSCPIRKYCRRSRQ